MDPRLRPNVSDNLLCAVWFIKYSNLVVGPEIRIQLSASDVSPSPPTLNYLRKPYFTCIAVVWRFTGSSFSAYAPSLALNTHTHTLCVCLYVSVGRIVPTREKYRSNQSTHMRMWGTRICLVKDIANAAIAKWSEHLQCFRVRPLKTSTFKYPEHTHTVSSSSGPSSLSIFFLTSPCCK